MDVERWVAAAVPWWIPRGVLLLGWAAALAIALGAEAGGCTVATPCDPDVSFAFAVVLLLAAPVLLLVGQPVAGCLAAAGFAVLDLLFDDVVAANVAFGAYGVVCFLVAVWIMRARAEQRHIAGGRLVGLSSPVSWGLSPVLVVLFAVLGALAFLSYDGASAEVDEHLRVASRMDAQVVAVQGVDVTLELPGGNRIMVDPLEQYAVGDRVPVLVDGPWVRLVAEPEDVTWRLTLGFALYLLVFLFLLRAWQRRALWGRPLPSVRLCVEAVGVHRILLRSPDGRPLALLRVDADVPVAPPPFTDAAHFGRVWRGEESPPPPPDLPEVTVAGELNHGGRVAVLVGDEILMSAVLRPVRGRFDRALPGTPVSAGSPVSLPVSVRSPARWEGLLLLALAVGLLIAVRSGVSGFVLLLGAQCLVGAWYRLRPLRLSHTALTVHAGLFVYHVPWTQLHGVRRDGRRLVLAFGPHGDLITVPDVPGLGGSLMWLRARGSIAGFRAPVSRSLGLVPLIVVLYLVTGLL
ncbi:hypothetical protein [Lentzea sp. NBRC 105346]|uniref:hypothetical protein n=1 Tax=Lentzea sp. NBRC 105346 TaxID=3032205 RepID=UPI002554FC8D|nr:hypothetical protein [Lentzea sp. NBRC 105346]